MLICILGLLHYDISSAAVNILFFIKFRFETLLFVCGDLTWTFIYGDLIWTLFFIWGDLIEFCVVFCYGGDL